MPSGRSQSLVERPDTLEAMTMRSRPPRALSQVPMIRSVEPWVSALGGMEYISAVSMKLMPRPIAMSSWAWPSASVFCWPQVMVPRQMDVTSRPGATEFPLFEHVGVSPPDRGVRTLETS